MERGSASHERRNSVKRSNKQPLRTWLTTAVPCFAVSGLAYTDCSMGKIAAEPHGYGNDHTEQPGLMRLLGMSCPGDNIERCVVIRCQRSMILVVVLYAFSYE